MTDQPPGAAAAPAPDSAQAAAAPGPIERGRYAVFMMRDGGLIIARSGPLCETCAGCGCGDQIEPLKVPAMLANMARAAAEGKMNVLQAAKAMSEGMRGNGR